MRFHKEYILDDDLYEDGVMSVEQLRVVIGKYADYYAEHDGMVESGPGCTERLQARIEALPDGHPSKIELRPRCAY